MPIYRARCAVCESEEEIFRSFSRYNDLPECCGEKMTRVICPSMVYGDIEPYISQIDGSIIASRSRHREHLQSHRCIEVGNETQTAPRLESPSGLKKTLIEVANAKLR